LSRSGRHLKLESGTEIVVDVRPVFLRLEERIRSHVLLCWLALLFVCVVENETRETWSTPKPTLAKVKAGNCRKELE